MGPKRGAAAPAADKTPAAPVAIVEGEVSPVPAVGARGTQARMNASAGSKKGAAVAAVAVVEGRASAAPRNTRASKRSLAPSASALAADVGLDADGLLDISGSAAGTPPPAVQSRRPVRAQRQSPKASPSELPAPVAQKGGNRRGKAPARVAELMVSPVASSVDADGADTPSVDEVVVKRPAPKRGKAAQVRPVGKKGDGPPPSKRARRNEEEEEAEEDEASIDVDDSLSMESDDDGDGESADDSAEDEDDEGEGSEFDSSADDSESPSEVNVGLEDDDVTGESAQALPEGRRLLRGRRGAEELLELPTDRPKKRKIEDVGESAELRKSELARKRKMVLEQQLEEAKTLTVQRLLNRQAPTKQRGEEKSVRPTELQGPHIRFRSDRNGESLSYFEVSDLSMPVPAKSGPPGRRLCSVCGVQPRRYEAPKERASLCSLACYKKLAVS